MTLLSGGVSEMAMPTTGQVANLQAYYQAYPAAINQTFDTGISYSQPSYYDYYQPPSYTVPIYQPSNYSYNYSNPTNVNYNPVQVSNTAVDAGAPTFNPVGPSALADVPGGIKIGNTTYSPQNLVASNPALTYAPGGFAAGRPQYDTRSDAASGYDLTGRPVTGEDQKFSVGADDNQQPDALAAPDIYQQQGIPNPFRQPPVQPNYYNSPANQQIMQTPDMVMNAAPNRADYYPSPQSMARPQNFLQRAAWAMPNQARGRAAAIAAAEDRYGRDLNAYTQMMSTMMPGVIGAQREIMQQQGADHRLNQQTFNQGALAALNFGFDQKEKQILSLRDGLNLAAQAFQLPSYINGQPNREKLLMLNTAGRQLGWSPKDIEGLFNQQDFNAAQQMKQEALKTESAAFALSANKEKLKAELALLRSQAAENFAQARLTGAQAGRVGFDLTQDQKIARDLRLLKLAQVSQAIGQQVEEKGTRDARIQAATLRNRETVANIIKKQLETQAIPLEIGAKLAGAMATLSTSTDEATIAAGNGLIDSTYAALGITQKPMQVRDQNGNTSIKMAPVNVSDQIQAMNQALNTARGGYRQRMQPAQPPANYFSGQPLAGGSGATPMSYRPDGEN